MSLTQLLHEISICRVCEDHLPHQPRPILHVSSAARLLIISQAPGSKVHQTGIPWNDASGDRLRDWMNVVRSTFYDKAQVAVVPIGLCYPGAAQNGGDKPPRPECAPLWHERVLGQIPNRQLTLLVGHHSQKRYLGSSSEEINDRDGEGVFRIRPRVFPTATSELAKCDLDATTAVVRTGGYS